MGDQEMVDYLARCLQEPGSPRPSIETLLHGFLDAEAVIKNDYVAGANGFDKAKVQADADGYALPDEYKKVDVEAIRARV